ncbi:hypothetical protein A3F03_02140 [Candidatus Roizmanbacteria bacterium RIFCSPHIGHO2_12_FULL_41_11]|uniref:N-acetyltransferase domain-containing protein n=3 Tax=Candidatus Roizmaniibacteriota TaxID=1752723 RepID=A0A1F7JQX6_9BACT|nr:MAG: hypothetical protein A3F03_02140 [Candidatus Roizmanbacteria bacterium RIFCSPHIGHO2_12_FULL_41_11]OGK51143.1 MAG: hypothetical protein A2966_00175 [Candidatus Roizmanbacteria bacterium RIFCSPLOWO2_01_FULL_41_22]OGK58002.1 MAG: hypothetical protein A3H86_00725 [Candidatus Roizmanbacteria bacterium RIFCSPLOWO2_02_FULL_41_9]
MKIEFTKTVQLVNNQKVSFRYPSINDVNTLRTFINKLSKEDTFIIMSGEIISVREESAYLKKNLKKIAQGDMVILICESAGRIIGSASVERNTQKRKRARHVGSFGISLLPEFRGQGLGKRLMEEALTEAKKRIVGLKMVTLDVFAPNSTAIDLYRKIGFQEVGGIPQGILFHGQYVDLIIMWKAV